MDNITEIPPQIDQKQNVHSYFNQSKGWQGELYSDQDDYFARAIKRRKVYALEMLKTYVHPLGGKALDVGCGSGIYVEALKDLGYEVMGVDMSEEMITSTRIRLDMQSNDSEKVHLRVGDVENIPAKDNEFDLVICIGVFGYLLSDEKAQAEIRRVLKPNGKLILNLTNIYSLSDIDFVFRKKLKSLLGKKPDDDDKAKCPDYAIQSEWTITERNYFFKAYNPWKYERVMAKEGFKLNKAMTYGFEFRILRKVKVIPIRWLDNFELFLERFINKYNIPYFSYAGWVYTGVFTSQK